MGRIGERALSTREKTVFGWGSTPYTLRDHTLLVPRR